MATFGSNPHVISHWHHPIASFQTSSLEFYAAVEQTLRPHAIPNLSTSRVDWKEEGVLSAKREYLRIRRGKLAFDVCAAPFGADFFFSSWLTELPPKYGILFAVAIVLAGLLFLGVCVQAAGYWVGFLLAVIGFPVLLLLLAYLVRQGTFGAAVENAVLAIPVFGWLYATLFKPNTFYKMDTTLAFQAAVHSVVVEVVDQLLSARGLRTMTELERKPILKGLTDRS